MDKPYSFNFSYFIYYLLMTNTLYEIYLYNLEKNLYIKYKL